MAAAHRLRDSAGFSLLESMVAVALLALIVASVIGAASMSGRTYRTTERMESQDAQFAARSILRSLISKAVPEFYRNQSGRSALAFAGEPDRLVLVAPQDGRLDIGGLYWLEFTVQPSDRTDGTMDLNLHRSLFRQGDTPVRQSRTVLTGMPRIRFAYFGRVENGEYRWHDAWPDRRHLPKLVRMTFAGAADTPIGGMPLTIAIASTNF